MVKQVAILCTLFLCFVAENIIGQDVYKTPSGKKFHLATCRMVENVSAKISLEKALETGMEPCKICKPPILSNAIPLAVKKPQGTNSTVQCKGTTKAGNRCKHMTCIANGYCFQHSP